MALLLFSTGEFKSVKPHDTKRGFTLTEVYELLHCKTIQMVECTSESGTMMLMDDEGKLAGKPINMNATALWAKKWKLSPPELISTGDHVVGDVLLCFSREFQ